MDWMYADDAPRAEQRAALLSLDRALLDELMGGEGADESTLAMLEAMLARRRGTAPGSRARTADELAMLLDRAADLIARRSCASASRRSTRAGAAIRSHELLERGRAIAIDIPERRRRNAPARHPHRELRRGTRRRSAPTRSRRVVCRRRPRAATGRRRRPGRAAPPGAHDRRRATRAPRALRVARRRRLDRRRPRAIRLRAARGSTSASTNGRAAGKLVRGTFGGDATTTRWCSRRLLEQARRRELAQARKQIEAVDLDRFSRFMLRWQHLDPRTRLAGDDGTTRVVRQMYGLAQPRRAVGARRTCRRASTTTIPTRSRGSSPRASSCGSADDSAKPDEAGNLSTVRFRAARHARARGSRRPTTQPLERTRAARARRAAARRRVVLRRASVVDRR